jgi:hypothetical protein
MPLVCLLTHCCSLIVIKLYESEVFLFWCQIPWHEIITVLPIMYSMLSFYIAKLLHTYQRPYLTNIIILQLRMLVSLIPNLIVKMTRFWSILIMVFNIRDYCVFGLRPLSSIPKNISETGSFCPQVTGGRHLGKLLLFITSSSLLQPEPNIGCPMIEFLSPVSETLCSSDYPPVAKVQKPGNPKCKMYTFHDLV